MLYVRTDGVVARLDPADLVVDGGSARIAIDTPVALREGGPFEPIGTIIEKSGPLRDVLSRAIPTPSLRSYKRLRLAVLAAALGPILMLLELDRELVTAGHASPSRVVIDLILSAFVLFEVSRPSPRLPGVAAIALVAIGLRWTLVAARLCGRDVHALVYGAGALAFGAALALLVRAPSRGRVALELLDKLGISRSALFAATSAVEPKGALVAAAVGCAAALPALLHLTRSLGGGLALQAIVFVGFALAAPTIARRTMDPVAPAQGGLSRPLSPPAILLGIAAGLAITAAAVTAGRLFFDVGAELARCVSRLDTEAKLARAAESAEIARAIAKVRASAPLVLMTALLFPIAEERIYRGLLQDVLVRKYGRSYGLFAASLAFAVVHVGIYEIALYQTLLLGLGFGIAYAEGGLLAAIVVHAIWNVIQLG